MPAADRLARLAAHDTPDRPDDTEGRFPMTTTEPARAVQAPAAGRRPSNKHAPTGADRIPRRSQGWYRDPLDSKVKLRSVTTILSQGYPKEALVFWAGNLTAQTALDNLPYLVSSSLRPAERAEAYDWLRRAHTRKKNARADIGGAVHKVIEAHILGQPIPAELLDDPEIAPYLEHFLRFVAEWEIEFEASEMAVAHYGEGYAGTLDYLFRSRPVAHLLKVPPGTVFMGDTKTGGELDVKGVYPEAGLQMAAYAAAEVGWLRDGTKVSLPAVHTTGLVLHLRPEGYRPIPVDCGPDVFRTFLRARDIAEFERTTAKTVVGQALTLPTPSEEGEAA